MILGEEEHVRTETPERRRRDPEVSVILAMVSVVEWGVDLRNILPEPLREVLDALAHCSQLAVACRICVRNSLKTCGPLLRNLHQGVLQALEVQGGENRL